VSTDYQSSKLNAYLELPRIGAPPIIFNIVSAQGNFSVNSIPTASVKLSIGREASSGSISNSETFDGFNQHPVVYIYLRVQQLHCSLGFFPDEWPVNGNGEFGYVKVFEGRVSHVMSEKSRTSATLTLTIRHWLADLEASSSVSRQTQQVAPQLLISNSSYLSVNGVGYGFFPSTLASEYFTPANVAADLWGEAFMPWMRKLCTFDALAGATGGVGENTDALAAINRIEPILIYNPAAPADPPTPTYFFGVPLSLVSGMVGASSESLCQAIAVDVPTNGTAGMLTASLWEKMLSWAADYKFTIVPLVDTAIVVPQVPGQREHWASLYGQEYRGMSQSSMPPRPIRGVRLFGGVGSPTGVLSAISTGAPPTAPLFAGGYDNPDFPLGQLRFQNAPRWAANVAAPTLYGSLTLMPANGTATAMFPGAGQASPIPPPSDIVASATGLWDAYARTVYISELLRNRTGSLQGKLRFDIAPGSTVRVQNIAERFVREQVGERVIDTLFAEVRSVSWYFDSESLQASTTFGLENIRDFLENITDATSVEQHPFYGNRWVGAPLSELILPSPLAEAAFEIFV
jgi:hypothetical protein